MARIKNMGSATMRFGEGLIVTGSAGTDTHSLVVTGSAYIDGDLVVGQYIKHGDSSNDTNIRLQSKKITFKAGSVDFLKLEDNTSFGSPENITFNPGNENIDVVFQGTSGNILSLDADTGVATAPSLETTSVSAGTVSTGLIEYTDGDDAITIEDGGFLRLNAGIKYARGVLVSDSLSPDQVGGWIKFATFNCPGGSSLDTAASSFFITFAGMESSGNRRIDGQFIVHAKFTVNTTGSGTDGGSVTNAYYEPEGTRISCEPMQAEFLAASGATDFDPATDLLMIFTNSNSTPVVDLYIKCNAKRKHCFVTHLGGTGQVDTSDTDIGWEINTVQSWSSSEPTAPAGSVKLSGTFVTKIFSKLTTSTLSVIGTTTDSMLNLETTEDSNTAGPVFSLKRNSGSPADADYLGQIKFLGENDADQEITYAKITGKIDDASDGTEDGILEFANIKAGSQTITARLRSDSLQLLNATNLTVDGNVGIGNTSPIANLDVSGSIAITKAISTPSQPAADQGYLYIKSDGKLYWRSSAVAETDLTATGGGSSGPLVRQVTFPTSNIDLATDGINQDVYAVDCNGGDRTVTLPAPSSTHRGKQITFIKNAGVNTLTITAGTNNIFDQGTGTTNYNITGHLRNVTLVCLDYGWIVIAEA